MPNMMYRIGPTDRILIVQEEWLNKIFSGEKTIEIRNFFNAFGRVYLCQSGTKKVFGYAEVVRVDGPLSDLEWENLRDGHGVPGGRRYGDNTYAWHLRDVTRLKCPVPIQRKPGSVGTQIGPE